jgi:hypothetical protein
MSANQAREKPWVTFCSRLSDGARNTYRVHGLWRVQRCIPCGAENQPGNRIENRNEFQNRVMSSRFHPEISNSHQAYYRQRTGGTPWSRPSLNTVIVSG